MLFLPECHVEVTHTFDLSAKLWQFPGFPQINEKSTYFQLFGTEQYTIK